MMQLQININELQWKLQWKCHHLAIAEKRLKITEWVISFWLHLLSQSLLVTFTITVTVSVSVTVLVAVSVIVTVAVTVAVKHHLVIINDRLKISVGDFLFLIGQILEAHEGLHFFCS